jgi:hypothetical protein
VITSANGISYIAAPAGGMLLYAVDPHLPFAVAVTVVVALAWWGRTLR